MNEWSVQDRCAIIGALGVVCGGLLWLNKWLNRRFKITKANMRVNFFRTGKSWRFRIYNSSKEEIEARNIRVIFPDEEYHVQWDSKKDMFPSLKRHGSFDIYALIYTSTNSHTTVRIEWNQEGSNKVFSTLETVSLD